MAAGCPCLRQLCFFPQLLIIPGWLLMISAWLLMIYCWLLMISGWLQKFSSWLLMISGWCLMVSGWLLMVSGWLLMIYGWPKWFIVEFYLYLLWNIFLKVVWHDILLFWNMLLIDAYMNLHYAVLKVWSQNFTQFAFMTLFGKKCVVFQAQGSNSTFFCWALNMCSISSCWALKPL